MIRQPNAPIIAWYQMITKSVDQFELNIHVLAPQTLIDSGHTEETLATYQMIHGEDIPICDSVWQGLQSTSTHRGDSVTWKVVSGISMSICSASSAQSDHIRLTLWSSTPMMAPP